MASRDPKTRTALAAPPGNPPSPMDRGLAWLAVPLLLVLLVFYAYPVLAMLWRSVSDPVLSLQHYQNVFEDPVILKVFWITLHISATVTLAALLLGYPLAYVMATAGPRLAGIMLALVLVPFWISILVRSYAWMVLLGRHGLINEMLMRLNITEEPIRLLNTTFATHIGMVHVLLPFMVLPLYSTLKSLDQRLLRAAEGLGARPYRVFLHIILPLSIPGIAAGCLLVFVLSLGFYVTPALLGGARDIMIAVLIGTHVDLFNWGLASALAAVLLVATLLLVAAIDRFLGLEKLLGVER
jgi:ABC-type spermidine/putrescine transport system permease subunit I